MVIDMGKDNVFLKDVDVPEVVREKMNAAFLTIGTERKNTMKKEQAENRRKEEVKTGGENGRTKAGRKKTLLTKISVAAAAAGCMAAAAMIMLIKGGTGSGAENETGLMSVTEGAFSLNIMGAELEKGKPVQMVSNASQLTEKYAGEWVLGGSEDGVDYCINVPLLCQGDNIKKVTYSINNGAFQVVQPAGKSIILDGQPFTGSLNTGIIGGAEEDLENEPGEEASEGAYELVYYQSFTLDYQKQSDENTWINICNERQDNGELREMIFGNRPLEEINAGMRQMLDGTVITCTVHYADGTSKTEDIAVTSSIMSCAEAGAEVKEDPDREEIFITFELQ